MSRAAGQEQAMPMLDERVVIMQSTEEGGLAEARREAAFGSIVTEFGGGLIQLATGMVGSDAAEDIVQEALIRAYQSMGSFESRGGENELRNWLLTITGNLARNFIRKESRGTTLDPDSDIFVNQAAGSGDPVESLEFKEVLDSLLGIFPKYRRALLMSMQGYSQAQMADLENLSVSAVNKRLVEGRKAARRILAA